VPITPVVESHRTKHLPAPPTAPRLHPLGPVLALIGVVLAGAAGIMFIEGWDFDQALFFTLITLTTVGYADYGISEAGKLFSIAMMIGGLCVVTYSAGQVLPLLFNRQLVWERKMNHRMLKLQDHFIVCGLGRIGQSVCRHLARSGVPFVGIDPDPESVATLVEADHPALLGDAADDDVLRDAGVERAKAIACVAGSDSANIVITLSAKAMNPALLIVSRAEQVDAIRKMERAGATRVISPIRSGGVSIVNAILKPNLAEFLDLTQDRTIDFELAEITVQAGSALDGSTIRRMGASHENLLVIALKQPHTSTKLRPDPNEAICAEDILIVAGDAITTDALQREASAPLAA